MSLEFELTLDPEQVERLEEHSPDQTVTHQTLGQDAISVTSELAGLPSLGAREPGDDFELQEVLGEGGMGVVRRAWQRSLKREVAVKLPRASADRSALEKLLGEATLTGGLAHPNIIPVHALGLGPEGEPMLIMKRVEGVSWRALIHDPDHAMWRERDAERLIRHLEVLIQVCHAVEFAHSRGVVHRDIKPENVMLGAFGEVYLLDWGIAMELGPQAQAHRLLGTPSYMAPEMVEGGDAVGTASDVYLLGATLYEVLTRRVPHMGNSVVQTLTEVMEKPCLSVEDAPEQLDAIIRRATARQPEDRYPSARAFREALEGYLRHHGASRLIARGLELQAELEAALQADDDAAINARLSESDMAFRMALDAWPGNARAERGLAVNAERVLRHAIARDQTSLAASLLSRLDDPEPELVAGVEVLQRSQEQQRQAQEALEAMRRDQTLSLGAKTRRRFLIGAIVFTALISVIILTMTGGETEAFTPREAFTSSVITSSVIFAALGLFRKRLLRNTISRRLLFGFLTVLVILPIHRGLGWHQGTPIHHILAVDQLILGGTWLGISYDMHRLVRLAGTLILAFALLSAAFPPWANTIFTFSVVLAPYIGYLGVAKMSEEDTSEA